MRHHLEAGGLLDFERGMVGTVTRAPAGAEGHRYVLRLERREDANRFAQPFDPWLPFGREEFEGKRPRFARTHQATLSMGSIFAPVDVRRMDAQPCQRPFFAAFYRPLSMLSVLLGAAFGPALVFTRRGLRPGACITRRGLRGACVTRRGVRPACGLCYSGRPSARLRFVLLGAAFGPPAAAGLHCGDEVELRVFFDRAPHGPLVAEQHEGAALHVDQTLGAAIDSLL